MSLGIISVSVALEHGDWIISLREGEEIKKEKGPRSEPGAL